MSNSTNSSSSVPNPYNLLGDEDSLIDVNNIEIQYSFGCLEENDPEACHLMADFTRTFKKNEKEAFEIYKKNCNDNHFAHSCYEYGHFLKKGADKLAESGDQRLQQRLDLEKLAKAYYEKSCFHNFPKGCYRAGLWNWPSKLAVKYFKRACALGQRESCFELGKHYWTGCDGVLSADLPKALQFFEQSCDLGDAQACINASYLCRNGLGKVPKDVDLADRFIAKYQNIRYALEHGRNSIYDDGDLS